MTIWDFASKHWFIFLLTVWILSNAWVLPFRCYFRHKNIALRGWPPAHCDAGGNLKDD